MTTFHLRTLGGLSLHPGSPEEPPVLGASKQLAVLAYLALAPGRSARRSHLSELLWPGLPRRKARRALRQALYYLTKQAGTELWRADDGTVALAAEKLEVDAWALDRALEEERWADAAELYGGPFLAGFEGKGGTEFDHWAEAQHERLWAGVRAACHALIEEALSGEGPEDAARAVRFARRCVELNPLDERAQEALVRAHLAAGDRVEAFRAYEAYRSLLRTELGEEPGPELASRTAELRETLFDRRAEPEGAPVPPPAVPLAYPSSDPEPSRSAEVLKRRYPWRSLAWVGTAAVLAAVVAGLGWMGADGEVRAREAAAGASGPPADLLVTRAGGGVRSERGDSALRIRAAGEGPAAVTPMALPRRRGVVSPDGRRVALTVRGPHGTDVGVREGGGKTRRLTSAAPDEWPQAWSPDGRRILYQYGDRRHGDSLFTTHLAVADAATGEVRRFPVAHPARADSQAVWSPTGTAVAFTGTEDGEAEVYAADADGRRETDVSRAQGPDRHPAWSPGGRWLAFASRRDGSWDIWLVRPDGTGLSRLTFSPEDETSPAWLSRREVAYVAERGGARDLWAVDVTTRSAHRLTTRGDLARVRDVGRPGARTRVDRVELEPRWKTVSPGQ
ncbi:MAG TPA: BTAD domain-containing putative transcriptional regulator, partial [Gemmatimonadota bacterium]|nr:BTAD domain-containing putative transcriptional regulator [Gemmatimonadota bacterium]